MGTFFRTLLGDQSVKRGLAVKVEDRPYTIAGDPDGYDIIFDGIKMLSDASSRHDGDFVLRRFASKD